MKALHLVLAVAGLASGQTFDVAAIKPPNLQSPFLRTRISGGQLTAENASLRILIQDAYELLPMQLSGGPGWLDSEKWSINAKGPDTATPREVRLMLRKLLADRFQLKLRVEPKEQATYALVVKDPERVKVKLSVGTPGERSGYDIGFSGPADLANPVKFRNFTMEGFAMVLSREVERMVFDQTGLVGEFNFALEATRLKEELNPFAAPLAPSIGDLGLRLESRKGPVDMYVVETAERPSEN